MLALYMRQLSVPGCRLKAHCAPRCPHSIERSDSGRALTPAHHPVTPVSCGVNVMQHSGCGAPLDYTIDGAAIGQGLPSPLQVLRAQARQWCQTGGVQQEHWC